jgi:hypothetical protein
MLLWMIFADARILLVLLGETGWHDPYPKHPKGDGQENWHWRREEMTLEQLKATGEQATLGQLIEAVLEENKD